MRLGVVTKSNREVVSPLSCSKLPYSYTEYRSKHSEYPTHFVFRDCSVSKNVLRTSCNGERCSCDTIPKTGAQMSREGTWDNLLWNSEIKKLKFN